MRQPACVRIIMLLLSQQTNLNRSKYQFSVFTPKLFYGTERESPSYSYAVRVNLDSESEDSNENEIDEQILSSDKPSIGKLIR